MTTDKALDLAYENPGTCITTEDYYEAVGGFFYYDDAGNLKDETGSIILESYLYKRIEDSCNEDFDEWIEVDATIEENFDNDGFGIIDWDEE